MWIYILIVVLLLILGSIAVIYHDIHCFVTRKYDVSTDKLDRDYTFVLLSDLHGYSFGKDNDKLLAKIDEIAPDFVLCAGDMFTGHKIDGKIQYETGLHVMSELARKYPVYMGNGNHEHKVKTFTQEFGNFYDRYRTMLKKAGVVVLENDSVLAPDSNIRISGLDLSLDYFHKVTKHNMEQGYIERLLGKSDKNRFQILIAHNPIYFSEYIQWGADLSVSGHVHGGIIRLPFIGGVISPAIALFPRFDGGKFEKDGKTMILSRGLGTHSIHVRMFNPCELDVITVHGSK